MKSMKVRSVRSAVLAGAVAVALATGGLAYGSGSDHDPNSTKGAPVGKAAPPGTARPGGTAAMPSQPGVKPSKTIPKGSTADRRPGVQGKVKKADRPVRDKLGAAGTRDRSRR